MVSGVSLSAWGPGIPVKSDELSETLNGISISKDLESAVGSCELGRSTCNDLSGGLSFETPKSPQAPEDTGPHIETRTTDTLV